MGSCIWIMNQAESRVGPALDWLTWTNYPVVEPYNEAG